MDKLKDNAKANAKPLKVGRKNGVVPYPKGRQADSEAVAALAELLPADLERDMLIEYFHLIQKTYGGLRHKHLEAVAELMKLPFAEVYEVATFYAHFKVMADDATPPTTIVRVCDSLTCQLFGGDELLRKLRGLQGGGIEVEAAPCMGLCHRAAAVMVNEQTIAEADYAAVKKAVGEHLAAPKELPIPKVKVGELPIWRRVKNGELKIDEVITTLERADLRGMGGAGFPSAKKWRAVLANPSPRVMTVNADEGEPGTFKDRWFMDEKLDEMLEGMLISAKVVEAEAIYFYIRGEYPHLHKKLAVAFAQLEKEKLTDGIALHLRLGAGAYICGEESAMIESIEGKRGLPRHRPPYIATKGLFGMPTLNHNVETLYWVSEILKNGGGEYAAQGLNGAKGLRAFSVSGRVASPGVKIAPLGITLRRLLDEYCGGMAKGHKLSGYLPGGASGGILPESMADLPLAFGSLEKYGCFVGSGAVIVFSDKDDIRAVTLNLLKFFEDESCGQCTPCRVGTEKSVALLGEGDWNEELLRDTIEVMSNASICGLGQAAGNPIACALKYFNPSDGAAGDSATAKQGAK